MFEKFLAMAATLVVLGVVAAAIGRTLLPLIVIGAVIWITFAVVKGLVDGGED